MPTNYCVYCGRFMMMREFLHACDETNKLRKYKGWCGRCGTPLSVSVNDDMERGLCHVCQNKIIVNE